MSIRVTTGKYKNKLITTDLKSKDLKFRPTTARTRMAIFNMLNHSKFVKERILQDAVVADICCGSGSYGLEALSRGAKKIYFIDSDSRQIKLVKKNVESFQEEANSIFLNTDATNLNLILDKIDVAFIDPPYESDLANKILAGLDAKKVFNDDHIMVIETASHHDINNIEGLKILDERRYGKTKIILAKFI